MNPPDNVFAPTPSAPFDPNGANPSVPSNTVPRDDKPTSREAIQAYRAAVMKQVRRMRLAAKKGPAKIVTRYTRRGKPVY